MAFSSNRFALLDDDTAPAPQPKAASAAPARAGQKNGPTAQSDRPVNAKSTRAGQKNGSTTQSDRPLNAEGPVGDDPVKDDRGGSSRSRGRGNARGARGTRGRGGRSDRPDRHSATGQEDSEKRTASGWGNDEGKKELADEDQGASDARAEAAPATDNWGDRPADAPGATPAKDDWGALPSDTPTATTNNGTSAPEPAVEEEPVDNSKTYEEYLAEKAQNVSLSSTNFNLRKANEGADESQWSSGVVLGQKEEDTFFVGKQAATKARKQKEDKRQIIEIEPTFRPPRTSEPRRGGFRGRGDGSSPRGQRGRGEGFRGRGSRGRGDFGGSRSQGPQVDTSNEADFPSLA